MVRLAILIHVLLLFVLASLSQAHSENWPQWRGPRGDGTVQNQDLPQFWDVPRNQNVAWKFKLPGVGHSSPIVWGKRVFITSCLPERQQRLLLCLDADSGSLLWQTVVLTSPLETLHKLNSHASATPATDGKHLFVAFLKVSGETIPAPNVSGERDITPGRIILSSLDLHGEIHWQIDAGPFISAHGFCSCPVVHHDLVILNGDHDGDSYVAAFNKQTGAEVWRTPRQQGIRSYVTPLIRTIDGQDQAVFSGSGHVAGFRVSDGQQIWKVEGPTEQFVASLSFDGQRFLLAGGYPTHHVMAITSGGQGDVTQSHVAWHVNQYVRCYVPSPVLVGNRLFVPDDRGTASCFDSATGERLWQARLAGGFSASLIATDRLVYFTDNDGTTKIIDVQQGSDVVSENALGEACYASPAASGGRLYFRTEQHLICIGHQP